MTPQKHSLKTTLPMGNPGPGQEPTRDPDIVSGYLSDASRIVGHAEALFRPRSEAEIAEILKAAQAKSIPITVVAEQTSTTGSSVPFGGWVLSMEKMNKILDINVEASTATAEGGVILGHLQKEVAGQGLFYPPDPTSRHESTLGASVACNASGARTFLYGATRKYVRGLRVVLANGEVLALRRGEVLADADGQVVVETLKGDTLRLTQPIYPQPKTKHAAGYHPGPELDLIDLFIGSEGTLGVITSVEVDCLPAPEGVVSLMAFFPSEEAALSFVEAARSSARGQGPITPRCLEWFDKGAITLIQSALPELGIPDEAMAGVFSEQEITDATLDERLDGWMDMLGAHDALLELEGGVLFADTEAKQEEFRRARHAVPAGANEIVARNGMPKVGTDLAVPDDALRAMVKIYHQAGERPRQLLPEIKRHQLLRELGQGDVLKDAGEDAAWASAGLPESIPTVTFGHVGDNHLHLNLLPDSPQALALSKALYIHMTEEAIRRGGTPSAEHGIGKIKREALHFMMGDGGIEQMRQIKRTLDPQGILGRGNLFDV